MGLNVNFFKNANSSVNLEIGQLHGGGVIISYKCTNKCKHCLVACSPERENRWMTPGESEEIFKLIKRRSVDAEIHIGGGEPFLNPDALLSAVECAIKNKINLSYVETNGFFGKNPRKYSPVLKELYKLGLRSILISVSPFHAEFIPPETTIGAITQIKEAFGESGAFIWIPGFLKILNAFDQSKTVKLENFSSEILRGVSDMYYLIPGGRCGYSKPELMKKRPAHDYFITDCNRELLSTGHFHIDYYGNYMPGGLCGGISLCTYNELDKPVNIENKPIVRILFNEGIKGLFEYALKLGYTELTDGYCGKCHLCVDIRKYLFKTGKYEELAPAEFYIELEK